jgi:hypothetical protein
MNPTLQKNTQKQNLLDAALVPQEPTGIPETDRPVVMPQVSRYSQSSATLLSDEAVSRVKDANTTRNVQSNFWYEFSSIMKWVTTFALAGAVVMTGQALGVGIAAGETAVSAVLMGVTLGPWALAGIALGAAVVAGAVLIGSSNHAKKLFIERAYDVQDFQMQRQAALIGKSVEHAVDDPTVPGQQPRWSQKFSARDTSQSWEQTTQASREAAATQAPL